jgi:hypothetical protein
MKEWGNLKLMTCHSTDNGLELPPEHPEFPGDDWKPLIPM